MNFKKYIIYKIYKLPGVFAVSLMVTLCGCKSHVHHDKKIFRYNEATGIGSLDPAFAKNQSIMWPVHQLYNTLVEVDVNMQITPSLARSWDFQ